MAIGMGRILGFRFLENFNRPYVSQSITEFWRRWHISLSSWFKDYVYIPLGGNRQSRLRTSLNLIVVFGLCGLWHGASWVFLLWGLYHGMFLVIERSGLERRMSKLPGLVRRLYTLIVVMVGWILFRSTTLEQAKDVVTRLIVPSKGAVVDMSQVIDFKTLACLAIACLSLKVGTIRSPKMSLSVAVGYASLFFLAIAQVSARTFSPFIYFKF